MHGPAIKEQANKRDREKAQKLKLNYYKNRCHFMGFLHKIYKNIFFGENCIDICGTLHYDI